MSEQERLRKKQFEKICRKVGHALLEYDMIEADDRVLVGLSGGKDSMILLEALANRKKHLPFNFEIIAVHVTAKGIGYKMDTGYLEQFCRELNVDLHLENIEVELRDDSNKSPCFICSWTRRKRIFELSRELDCSKVALGHHKDDAIQTLLLNMIYHGSISSLPQDLSMFDGRIRLIRPMLFIPEFELSDYAGMRTFRKVEKSCPFEGTTKRDDMKELMKHIDKLSPDARRNIFNAMDNIYREYLPGK